MTAWIGLIAMCLIVFAPVVSQLLRSGGAQDYAARMREQMAAECPMHQHPDAEPHAFADPLSACGYCDLLGQHPAMPSIPPVTLPLVTLVALSAARILSTRFVPLGAFPSGRPRAPPAVS